MQIVGYIVAILLFTLIILLLIPPLHKENFEMLGEDWTEGAKITTIQAKNLKVTGGASLGKIEATSIGTELQGIIMKSLYPVGSMMIRNDKTKPDEIPGLKETTWTQIGVDKYIKSTSNGTGTEGSATSSATIGSTSLTTPAGTSGSTILGISQIPSHTHKLSATSSGSGDHSHNFWMQIRGNENGSNDYTYANSGGKGISRTTDSAGNHSHSISGTISETGGNSGHTHIIPALSIAGHTHSISNIPIEPVYQGLAFWKRTA